MNDNDFDIFDDGGDLEIPTMRGSANLDVQDYARDPSGDHSDLLDDDLQEDTRSTPGSGAGPATDIDGTERMAFLQEDDDAPGMDQTTYGASPWGVSASEGYRPDSMARTDMTLAGSDDYKGPKLEKRDSMYDEPEVAVHPGSAVRVARQKWSGNRNPAPSNAEIDPSTIYDRDSYEYNDSTQSTVGSGIFGMEEGVTWRPRDGSFANQYAEPEYIGEEDELGVQQSQMWDTVANNWRVTQMSGGGVTFSTKVDRLKQPLRIMSMRPDEAGPHSHIEAFGRKAALALISEARAYQPQTRSTFLTNALESLDAGTATRANAIAAKLISMGYKPELALEDVVAHCVMHAAMRDLTTARGKLPRLDRLVSAVGRSKPSMQAAAVTHIAPLMQNGMALKSDLGALWKSPALRGMGQVTDPAAAAVSNQNAPAAGIFSMRNILIAGAVGTAGYLAWSNRRTIQRNAKKLAKKIGYR